MPAARVQALNEIRFAEGRLNGECSLLTASKEIVEALTAIAPVLDTVHTIHLANAINLLICTQSDTVGSEAKFEQGGTYGTRKGAH